MVAAVLPVMLRHRPVAPSLGKWTKLGAAVDLYVLWLVHDILQKFWQAAFVKLVAQKAVIAADGVDEAGLPEEISWAQVAGPRCKRGLASLGNKESKAALLSLSVVLEPLRRLTSWFLAAGHSVVDYQKQPALCKFVTENRHAARSHSYNSRLACHTMCDMWQDGAQGLKLQRVSKKAEAWVQPSCRTMC